MKSLHNYIILGLAAVIVYPDKVLDWIGEHTGRVFGWWYIVLLVVVSIGLMFIVTPLLLREYPSLKWWLPLLYVGIWGLVRIVVWFLTDLFGSRDS